MKKDALCLFVVLIEKTLCPLNSYTQIYKEHTHRSHEKVDRSQKVHPFILVMSEKHANVSALQPSSEHKNKMEVMYFIGRS